MDKTHVVFAGNPGVGKSFILNSLIGQVTFKSGINIGEGMTKVLERYDASDYVYFDTPGLDDISIREQAALEISQALEGGCEMKLIFVVTLEAGRIKPADLTTIKVVLKAIEDVGVDASGRYSVIVNKCNSTLMKQFEMVRPREKVRSTFCMVKYLRDIEFFPKIGAADEEGDYLLRDNSGYAKFVKEAPTMRLPENAQVKIDATNYDKIYEQYEKELESLRNKLKELEGERNDDKWMKLVENVLINLGNAAGNRIMKELELSAREARSLQNTRGSETGAPYAQQSGGGSLLNNLGLTDLINELTK